MIVEEPRSGLPIEFLRAIAAQSGPDSPPVGMAVARAHELPEGSARDDLLLALLLGALSASAPEWMLSAAIDSDLRQEAASYASYSMHLSAAALGHPSCPDELRAETLRRCSVAQLGALGRRDRGATLTAAVVTELRRRGPHGQPMTPALLEDPGTAQVILREPTLDDSVFAAALGLLPVLPSSPRLDEGDGDVIARFDAYMATLDAGSSMWEAITRVHIDRHRQLVEWAQGTRASHYIRKHLLGTIPWDVEGSLLEEIAVRDLADFPRASLITRISRLLRDGASEADVRSRFAGEFASLSPKERRHVEEFFDESPEVRSAGLRAAVLWVESRADTSWRHILTPSDAKDRFGRAHTWRAPQELLVTLGERFAAVAEEALDLWETDPGPGRRTPRDLRWLHSMLLHLPQVTNEVKDKARAVLRHARPQPRRSWEVTDLATDQHDREFADLRTAIDRILGDPTTAARSSALGDPQQVTVRDLATASDEVLDDYLSRHAGIDELVEKALLSFVSRDSYRPKLGFSDVLGRHSSPQEALLQVTAGLRKRLGGGPHLREAWVRQVLRLPECDTKLICALPAWAALTVGGPEHGTAHAAVASVVTAALGEDEEAWARFATSPASYSGPTAWLRLGDILTAAKEGSAWPKPPSGR
ncbi:hypothetical protein [Streptomyces sp. NPDC048392]|uniref:hypothetical protein n=1 Tax=Streptomyces sp. NPDC048392 TaxID=3365543 RepID=UPI00371ECD4F